MALIKGWAPLGAPSGSIATPERKHPSSPGNQSPSRIRLISFKPHVKGVLRGFATVELPNGLTISDCQVCISHAKLWASLPSKPVLDCDGRQIEHNGKKQYVPVLRWRDQETADRWSAAVIALVRAEHPEALS